MKVLFFIATTFLTVNAVSFFDLALEEWQLFKVSLKYIFSTVLRLKKYLKSLND